MQELSNSNLSAVSGGFEVEDIGYAIGYGVGYVFSGKAGYKLGVSLYEIFH